MGADKIILDPFKKVMFYVDGDAIPAFGGVWVTIMPAKMLTTCGQAGCHEPSHQPAKKSEILMDVGCDMEVVSKVTPERIAAFTKSQNGDDQYERDVTAIVKSIQRILNLEEPRA